MDIQLQTPPDLEERFTQPPGWRWHSFERVPGRRIVFGSVSPQDSIPDATVVCLEGVREFSAKYFETARWCLDHNMAFWVMDWAGQGMSTRFLDNPQKRHSTGFGEDVADLHYFIMEYIKHSSVHPDKGRIPLVMLAQSMGANPGLRYLHDYPGVFRCAALNAPMTGLFALKDVPPRLGLSAAFALSGVAGKSYAWGQGDWENKQLPEDEMVTSDPVRGALFNQWLEVNPVLRCGGVTNRWIYEAQKSNNLLHSSNFARSIETPCLIVVTGHEHLVDNEMTRKLAASMPHAQILELPDSYHESMLETERIRNAFWEPTYALIKETAIDDPEALKPF
ncbi:MAG: alpha/beta hydrolase [Alphaproteobacteria bacterium]|nr:alpha/beta hydrolase [Alphaproteobacteria bacterium]